MIVDCIGCLHGHFPQLEGGDLLIVTGDLTARDTPEEWDKFYDWLDHQDYKKKIFICGNHDNYIQKEDNEYLLDLVKSGYDRATYLCDSGTEYEGLNIWGSPWTKKFEGQNPKAMAFCLDTDEELEEKWKLIPDDTDILITHGPPFGILDKTNRGEHVGSESLFNRLAYGHKMQLHVFSHIHEGYGHQYTFPTNYRMMLSLNCSLMNEKYQPVNKPISIITCDYCGRIDKEYKTQSITIYYTVEDKCIPSELHAIKCSKCLANKHCPSIPIKGHKNVNKF